MKKLFLLLTFSLVQISRADLIAVPDTPDGDTRGGFFFGYGPTTTIRYQEIYSASAFSTLPSGGYITGLAFRFDCPPFQICSGGTVPDLQINLSTTPKSVDRLSGTFSENIGANDTMVLGPRPVDFFANGSPIELSVLIPLDRNFFYDPNQGSLLMDVRLRQIPASGPEFDAANVIGDPVSMLYAFDVNALTGSLSTGGLVTGFNITAVPEPSVTWIIAAAGLSLLFCVTGRRRQEQRMTNATFARLNPFSKSEKQNKTSKTRRGIWH